MKKETNPKAKRNGLLCNVLIVAALLLIVAVLMVVLRRNAPANVDANAPLQNRCQIYRSGTIPA